MRNRPEKRSPVLRKKRVAQSLERAADLCWFALVVPPQKEFLAQEMLHDRGLATFVPAERKWRRRNKYAKVKELIAYALAPRYVFVGFKPGESLWFELFNLHYVSGIVGLHGKPKEIPRDAMISLIERYSNGLNAPDVQRYMRTRREFTVGQTVEVTAGPFEGRKVKVQEISRARARVIVELFSYPQEVEVPVDILEAA
jgi:transcription antitermination factor NusG